MIKTAPISHSLPCTTKDIQAFVLRKPKYMRAVGQFNEDEPLPPHFIFQFFNKVKDVKQLKNFNLKWNYLEGLHIKPQVVKKVFKHQCQNIQKYDVTVLDKGVSFPYKNLCTSLKNIVAASCDNNKGLRKLMALKAIENLRIDLKSNKNDYKVLNQVLYRLCNLKNLHITCLRESLDDVLMVLNELTMTRPQVKFKVFTIGKHSQYDPPQIETRVSRRIVDLSFQNIHPRALLNHLFIGKSFMFSSLKTLKLEFNTMSTQDAYSLHYLQKMANLEKLMLTVSHCQDIQVVSGIVTGLRLPPSLQSLNLNIPLHLSSLLTKTKRFLAKKDDLKKGYPWRNRNIFEEESAFAFLFQTFSEAKNLKNIVFDFHMLEAFNSHYTNFIISILSRLLNLHSLEIQVVNDQNRHIHEGPQGSFDLALFFNVCSKMPRIEQIEILMPNLIFEGAEFIPSTSCLKNLTIGVDEKDEDKPIKFLNIEKPVEKLLKALMKHSPTLENLSLDFAEEITEKVLLKRFHIIERFKNLEAFGARFFISKCSEESIRDIGRVIRSLLRLNMLLLKFLETEKTVYNIQNYIKYHKSLRNMMIQFNDSAWMDNECLIDTLGTQIKETKIEVEEDGNEGEHMNILEQSFDEL